MKFLPIEISPDNYIISIDDLNWVEGNVNECGCSFAVLGARLLNLSYPNYLRYLRANGADLKGKTGIATAFFKDKAACQSICTTLNKEWNKIKSYVEE